MRFWAPLAGIAIAAAAVGLMTVVGRLWLGVRPWEVRLFVVTVSVPIAAALVVYLVSCLRPVAGTLASEVIGTIRFTQWRIAIAMWAVVFVLSGLLYIRSYWVWDHYRELRLSADWGLGVVLVRGDISFAIQRYKDWKLGEHVRYDPYLGPRNQSQVFGDGTWRHPITGWTVWYVFLPFGILPALCSVILAGIFLRARRRYRRSLTNRCLSCGYDLTGNVSGRCPECGVDLGPRPADKRVSSGADP